MAVSAIPQQISIAFDEGFTPEKDIFGYLPYGEKMMALLGSLADPSVLILDGPWGCGKTTFIKMWQGLLHQNGFETVFIDAFAEDYNGDTFSIFAGEVYSKIKKISESEDTVAHDAENFCKAATGVMKQIAIGVAKVGVKVITQGAIDKAAIDSIIECKDIISDESANVFDKILTNRITGRDNVREISKNFALELRRSADLIKNKTQKPLVIIIDDLDRCKPTFAVDFIETIKHYYSVENVHFVLVTNLLQLRKSISLIYGTDSPDIYLSKFYNLYVNIQSFKRNARDGIEDKFVENLFSRLSNAKIYSKITNNHISTLSTIARIRKISLRDTEKVATYIILSLYSSNRVNGLDTILSTLCALRVCNYEIYRKSLHGTIGLSDIQNFLAHDEHASANDVHVTQTIIELFEALILNNMESKYYRHINSIVLENGFHDAKSILSYICALIEMNYFTDTGDAIE